MNRKDGVRHLWRECFRDSDEYLDMYFGRIYSDDDALVTEVDGRVVSSLLMQRYSLRFHGAEPSIMYLAGAATRRAARGRGYMSALMLEAMERAYERGDMLCALMPAHEWLYAFFARFGFSSVFLADVQRFTSLHSFPVQHDYHEVDDAYAPAVYEAFTRYEHERPGGVLHTRRDFINMLDDLMMHPGGTFVAVGRKDVPVAAMAWAVEAGGVVQVNELLGIDSDACTAALRALRRRFADKPFRYMASSFDDTHNSHSRRRLHPRGMARLVDVEQCFDLLAGAHREWSAVITVSDPLLAVNSHTYRVGQGKCVIDDSYRGTPDLDVTVEVLTKILFSSPDTGSILGFPSQRTHISLMPH